MKKRILAAVTALFCFLAPFCVCAEEGDSSVLQLQSKSAVLMDQATGTVIYEKNSHEAMPLASVTKIMTLLLIYEAHADGKFAWTDAVQVSEHAAAMGGSQVFLESGETQTAADMTKCIAIASANDAAVAMAEFVAGSEEAFVEKMNERAKELGMEDTKFVNACGLDVDGHVSSAYDIALMSRALMKGFPEIQEYTTTWMDTITHKTRKGESEFGLTNTNKLIKWYDGATGLKTGSTSKALYCLSGTAERNGFGLIAVVMAAPDFKIRFQEDMKLLDYGFANYAVEKGYPVGEDMGIIPVEKGSKEGVHAIVKDEISVLITKGGNGEWETKTEMLPMVKAPVAQGSKVGELIYVLDGKEVGRTDLVAAEAVEKASIHIMLQRMMTHWC
ncbi:D-alanyl-D-alanine carboxypeptidase DacF precursor [Anaerotignum neopropionicum]|uniref:serine-type D-Ala-D-Ala carboxypeptidase n=1 Tax=Anaerotignum neopropionicum TaxID=36847 RepID=A0A136WCY9_9FIRM|nr:D-alanyl-D-alanine carboxypeptidase family protein [Anaerotignum neopropionicum]KXL52375.1 D-alanyl-D-alanine carboxypeptidase DacF precursor [Anaerotignum neopropionicum]